MRHDVFFYLEGRVDAYAARCVLLEVELEADVHVQGETRVVGRLAAGGVAVARAHDVLLELGADAGVEIEEGREDVSYSRSEDEGQTVLHLRAVA